MRISEIIFKNFKRFTNLTINAIPATARLVLVVGPNGSGKSSILDGLYHWNRINSGRGHAGDDKYYKKKADEQFNWHESVTVNFHGVGGPGLNKLYLRTAYRNDPDFSADSFRRPPPPSDLRFERLIDNDQTVSQNYQRLLYDSMTALYDEGNDAKTTKTVRNELIGGLQQSLRNVFGDLKLNSLTDPLASGSFVFGKGTATSYHYKNLSGGEKAAFDLLLDLHVKSSFYPDAIYCIDEIETHLHTRVQGALLKEILEVIPKESQLWITTHSLGVLRAAQKIAKANPEMVCAIDFDGRTFDEPQLIIPAKLNRLVWDKFLSIALDDLSPQISPRFVIICEGSTTGKRRKDFDADIYNRIFESTYSDLVFISGGSGLQVVAGAPAIQETLTQVVTAAKVAPLRDRDDLSPAEVTQHEANGVIVLSKRNLESYLFSDEVLMSLANATGQPQKTPALLQAKATALTNSTARGNAPDDMKSAAGEIYSQIRQILGLTRCGSNTDAFMRDTLAPLILPGMPCYEDLKRDITDKIGV